MATNVKKMTTETLKIQIPEGFIVESFNQTAEEFVIKISPSEKQKSVFERIKTFEDVLRDNDLTLDQFENDCAGMEVDETAFRFLKLLAKSLNEGWEPDWNDEYQWKYVPWFYMGGSSGCRFDVFACWRSSSNVGSRLCFKSKELATYAGQQFTDQYKRFMLNTTK